MATNTIIKPSVGRKVWCFISAQHYVDYQKGVHEAQPHDGTVIYVHDDRCVNVRVSGHNGEHDIARGLPLVQEGDPEPNGAHARWMPYQTAQQAKADEKQESGVPPGATQQPERTQNNEGDPIGGDGQVVNPSDPNVAVAANPESSTEALSDPATNLGSKL